MNDAHEWNSLRYSPARGGGHVESYFFKLNSPDGERALWLRTTLLARPGAAPVAEAWAISFRRDGRHVACKEVVPLAAARFDPSDLGAEVASLRTAPGSISGSVARGPSRVAVALTFEDSTPPLVPFPHASMYTGALPKSKLVSPYPDARFDGWYEVDGERVDVRGWRGMQGHNWGPCHTHHYAWAHCNQFDGEDAVFEGLTGRVKMGPLVLPPLTLLCLRYRGARYSWNRLRDLASASGSIGRRTWSFRAENDLGVLEGTLSSPDDLVVGLLYENPEGPPTYCLNSKLSTATLSLTPRGRPPVTLRSRAAALEIATTDPRHGVRLRA
ncbi:MAG: hypothetical protein IT374_07850 [Polyangiaceae bacterium]|nr:hypothetical protein [Polyangiaceae bacterium]